METETEKVTTTTTDARRESTGSQMAQNIVYYVFGTLELLLVFRLLFRLFGANESGLVSWVYGSTAPFIAPFLGIFPNAATEGVVNTAVFEPATLLAIIVYALIAWGIAKLISIFAGERQE